MFSFTDLMARRAEKVGETGPAFLSLPPEIRNMVYEYLFSDIGDRTTLALNPPTRGVLPKVKLVTGYGPATQTNNQNNTLALLSTNHQVRSEAYGYVYHGQVPTEFRMLDNTLWLFWNIDCEQLASKLMEALAKHGSNLDRIKHLKLVGETALLALTHDPAVGFEIVRRGDNNDVYKAPAGEDVSKALVAARGRLSGVEIIEITAPIFGGWHADVPDSWLAAVMKCGCRDPSCGHQSRLASVFPHLKEVRMQTVGSKYTHMGLPVAGTRFFKRPNGSWRPWHMSEENSRAAT
ncbi:hypothetical protein LTR10_001673 [Elasticomyces elasticus]|nr:hypothetical protein LTR10_001673 [Elasticomyces elasticus]KAK4975175.1 hypothetical protein LTR42_004385 [Elasticomyces elasticus]